MAKFLVTCSGPDNGTSALVKSESAAISSAQRQSAYSPFTYASVDRVRENGSLVTVVSFRGGKRVEVGK